MPKVKQLRLVGTAFVLLLIAALFSPSLVRGFLGLIVVLFLPGYSLSAVLFPYRGQVSPLERVALSVLLSLALSALAGLGLNYTPWGLKLIPVLIVLGGGSILAAIIAWYRRKRLSAAGRLSFYLPAPRMSWNMPSMLDKGLMFSLVAVIIMAIVTMVYTFNSPSISEQFTEFYILGENGKLENYGTVLSVYDEQQLLVGVVNHERHDLAYTIKLRLGDQQLAEVQTGTLSPGQRWESPISFTPASRGSDQKLELLLIREDRLDQPYRSLHLWLDIT